MLNHFATMITVLSCTCNLLFGQVLTILPHQSGYDTYNYSYEDGSELAGTQAYLPSKIITGADMNVGDFNKLSDVFFDETNKKIYLADSGNNRIIVTNTDFQGATVFTGVKNKGKEERFSSPNGLFIAADGMIYIADLGNKRIVKMDKDGNLVKAFYRPVSPQFGDDFEYKPLKVAVSTQGDIFVVCEGVYEGLVTLDQSGEFQGYSGMNLVKPSPWDLFWRMFSTRKQLESMVAFLPVNFNNLELDDQDFIYATSQNENNRADSVIKRLNSGGDDVFRNNSGFPVVGDSGNLNSGRVVGSSLFNDIAYLGDGITVCTDLRRAKIFMYNGDGEMLFAFGGIGGQDGNLTAPSGIDNDGYRLYVTDSVANQIVVYEPTEYGESLIQGVVSHSKGNYTEAEQYFSKAFRFNSNCEIAYLGIGKAQMRNGEYKDALKSFRLASNRTYYSKALKMYRKDVFSSYFNFIFLLLLLLLTGILLKRPVKNLYNKRRKLHSAKPEKERGRVSLWTDRLLESFDFSFYCIFHPFKGFHELKAEKRGTIRSSILILFLFVIVMMMRTMLTGFVLNPTVVEKTNPIMEGMKACLPILLFSIANWCVTTLMDGEGSFKYIFMSSAYSLMPVILAQIPLIILSNMLIQEEAALYYTVETIVFIYTVFLLLAANMSVHNFTMGRTVATAIVTCIGMGVIVFILFLFFNLGFEVIGFVSQIYKEMIFRV